MCWAAVPRSGEPGGGSLGGRDRVRSLDGPRRPVTLDDLAAELRRFAAERDWERFHTPKNLAISLAVETGELLEHVQWGSDDEIAARFGTAEGRKAVSEEMADVLIYLVRLADVIGVDLLGAASAKIAANAARYPADEVRGSSAKRGR